MNNIRIVWEVAWRLLTYAILLLIAMMVYRFVSLVGISFIERETPWAIAYFVTSIIWLFTNLIIVTVWREKILTDMENASSWLSNSWLGKKNEQLNSWVKCLEQDNTTPVLVLLDPRHTSKLKL